MTCNLFARLPTRSKASHLRIRNEFLRWAREKAGLRPQTASAASTGVAQSVSSHSVGSAAAQVPKSIKAFLDEKDPKSDVHLAATIAYFYRFEAPPEQRREQIDANLLRDACRLAGRPGKLVNPLTT
jgi:hypothetical protein